MRRGSTWALPPGAPTRQVCFCLGPGFTLLSPSPPLVWSELSLGDSYPVYFKQGADACPSHPLLPQLHAAKHLDALLAYLHPRGRVEGPLRQALSRIRQAQAACNARSAAAAVQGAGGGSGAAAATEPRPSGAAAERQPLATAAEHRPSVLVLSEALRRVPTQGTADEAQAAVGVDRCTEEGDRAPAVTEAEAARLEAEAVRSELTALYHTLPESAFGPFWGSEERQVSDGSGTGVMGIQKVDGGVGNAAG